MEVQKGTDGKYIYIYNERNILRERGRYFIVLPYKSGEEEGGGEAEGREGKANPKHAGEKGRQQRTVGSDACRRKLELQLL